MIRQVWQHIESVSGCEWVFHQHDARDYFRFRLRRQPAVLLRVYVHGWHDPGHPVLDRVEGWGRTARDEIQVWEAWPTAVRRAVCGLGLDGADLQTPLRMSTAP